MTEQLPFHFSLSCTGEGNGNLLQCPCLENPRDRGAWWASVYGIAQSQTRLKRPLETKPSSIAPQPVESQEAPTNSTVSLSSQRHKKILCDPMDCSLPGSSVHGISQARILEQVAISFSRGSSRPRDRTRFSCIGRWTLYHGATGVACMLSYGEKIRQVTRKSHFYNNSNNINCG